MKLHKDSHLDHGINDAQLGNLLQRFEGRTGFFIATFDLPDGLGDVPCALFGPLVGDEPVPESEVVYRNRGEREYPSRIIETAYERRTRKVTVIAGPHGDETCILYTAFGGPQTPQEPGDLVAQIAEAQKKGKNTAELWERLKTSREFWSQHALIEVVPASASEPAA
jgi:hypothetical protein